MERLEDKKYTTDYERAKNRVDEIKSFYNHLITYAFVIGGLAALNYYQNHLTYAWFMWAALGWGIGLGSHAFRTFYGHVFFGKDWEERKIKEEMDKEARSRSGNASQNTRWE